MVTIPVLGRPLAVISAFRKVHNHGSQKSQRIGSENVHGSQKKIRK